MKKFLILFILFTAFVFAQTSDKTIWWDLNGDEVADETYTISLNDTINCKLYITSQRASDSIYAVDFVSRYGHAPHWFANTNSQNCLTFVDTTALRDTATAYRITTYGKVRMDVYVPSKKFYFSWADTAALLSNKRALVTDTMIVAISFKGTARGKQVLEILPENLPILSGWTVTGGTRIFGYGGNWFPYSLKIKNCIITVQ